ncbi:hypothetical protein PV328_008587, partial [Microctonus aethiopoides]
MSSLQSFLNLANGILLDPVTLSSGVYMTSCYRVKGHAKSSSVMHQVLSPGSIQLTYTITNML